MISVIIPVYKVEHYLNQCVQSVVDQTYKDLEIILVDDGSPDNCGAICDQWGKRDSRIRVIHKQNGGLSDARNAGMKIASGEYIAFVDSDDWVDKEFVETMYKKLESANADIVECGTNYADNGEEVLRVRSGECSDMGRVQALFALIEENGISQTVWNKLYRREVVENIIFPVGKYHEDDAWTYRVINRCKKITVIDTPLYFYRQRDSSIMGAAYNLKRLDGLEARYDRIDFFKSEPSVYAFAKERFLFDCMYQMQCALKYLNSKDQNIAIQRIRKYLAEVGKPQMGSVKYKYRIWFELFLKFPIVTAHIRNILGVGL